jgi:flagellar basal-body rod modification protein FlgD
MTTSPISPIQTGNVAAASANTTATGKKNDAEGAQDRFLKLLVTQMQNQDPLNPADNAQVTSQFAQISTVQGIEKLNQSMGSLTTTYATQQSVQATSMIGKSVLAKGDQLPLLNQQSIGGVELSEAVDKLVVSILNSAGDVVQAIDLGAKRPGVVNFAWDGVNDAGQSLPDGKYSFTVSAEAAGQTVKTVSLAMGQVNSVAFDKSGAILAVSGLGNVPVGDIKQVV